MPTDLSRNAEVARLWDIISRLVIVHLVGTGEVCLVDDSAVLILTFTTVSFGVGYYLIELAALVVVDRESRAATGTR